MSNECEQYEKKFKDVTLHHFRGGLSALLNFANYVNAYGYRDLEESECTKIKTVLETAHKAMSKAEDAAGSFIESLMKDTLQLALNFDEVKLKRKDLKESLQAKKYEMMLLENQRFQVNDQLQAARMSLQHTENALNAAEVRKGEKTTGRDMGIGLILLAPCVDDHNTGKVVVEDSPSDPSWRMHRFPQDPLRTTATGIPMTVDYNKELKSTRKLLKEVEKQLYKLKDTVKEKEEEMKKGNSQILENSKETKMLKDNLAQTEIEVERMQMVVGALNDTKTKLKFCYNYLYSLQGLVEVLYQSSEDIYSLEPIKEAIEDTLKAIQQPNSHNELLTCNVDVQKVATDLRAIQYQIDRK
ncbi:uncharacterized protein LOC129699384 isoform X1 [Leucoraja erinacea]|uniref:uncharacterized protein LOC129699384 isoform X1 n=1 Tax=Leucoraja erinaceus TaxID=7782 RepID=UPI0024547E85|nr:uncharacterized protein LOC129699384 isoform X1 [Leucoraja erinacea]